jgi:hypothetical protein
MLVARPSLNERIRGLLRHMADGPLALFLAEPSYRPSLLHAGVA